MSLDFCDDEDESEVDVQFLTTFQAEESEYRNNDKSGHRPKTNGEKDLFWKTMEF